MYLFLHIPKAAGTTFTSLLRRNFKERFVPIYGLKKTGFFSDSEVKTLATFFPQAQCIATHKFACPIPQPENTDIRYKLITFLRDPVDRALSHYLFHRKRDKLGIIKKELARLPFEEYFEKLREKCHKDAQGEWSYLCNMQAYILDRNYNIEEAKKRIKNEFFFAGVSERFDECLLLLKKRFKKDGIDLKINYFMKNVGGGRKNSKEFLAPKVYDKVLESNRLDKDLHDFVNQLLDEEIKGYGNQFYTDLASFKKEQKRLSSFTGSAELLSKFLRYQNKLVNKWLARF